MSTDCNVHTFRFSIVHPFSPSLSETCLCFLEKLNIDRAGSIMHLPMKQSNRLNAVIVIYIRGIRDRFFFYYYYYLIESTHAVSIGKNECEKLPNTWFYFIKSKIIIYYSILLYYYFILLLFYLFFLYFYFYFIYIEHIYKIRHCM